MDFQFITAVAIPELSQSVLIQICVCVYVCVYIHFHIGQQTFPISVV